MAGPGSPEGPFEALGRYRLLEPLGQGAMAEVRRAVDLELGREVAIKILRTELAREPESVRRFLREAKAIARLQHRHIVRLHDFGVVEGRLFHVLELVEGPSLARLVAGGRPSGSELLALLEDVARAVGHAHERGVVHRDLKPANILVGEGGEAKVADFGLAHLADGASDLTRTGGLVGTPRYMAPEQVEGAKDRIGPWTDVYALGAMLYEFLTGVHPHPAATAGELFAGILGEPPRRPREIAPGVTPELEAVVLRALEKDPRRRYPGGTAFAEDLARARSGGPIDRRTWSSARRRARTLHRAIRVLAWIGVAALAVGGAWAMASLRMGPGEPAPPGGERHAPQDSPPDGLSEALVRLEAARPALDAAIRASYDPAADFASARSRLAEARAAIEEAARSAPRSPLVHYLLGATWELEGRLDRAEASWRRSIELDPGFAMAHYRLGRLLLEEAWLSSYGSGREGADGGRAAEGTRRLAAGAAESLRRAGQEEGRLEGGGLHDALARAFLAYAEDDFETAGRLSREGAETFRGREGVEEFHLLLAHVARGAEALAAADAALQVRPRHPLALFTRGWRRQLQGDLEGALADYEAALELRPRQVAILVDAGGVSDLLGRPRDAIALFDRALEVEPLLPEIFCARAAARIHLFDLAGARADLDEAIRLDPAYALARRNRAPILEMMGDAGGALGDLDEAIRSEPSDPDARVLRSRLLIQLGRRDEAAADLEAALEVAPPDWPFARWCTETLESLRGGGK